MNNRSKILVIMHSMHIGGAERALLGLLNSFDYSKFDVDLFLFWHEGELLKYIPKEVNILESIEKYSFFARPLGECLKNGKFSIAFSKIGSRIMAKPIFHKEKKGLNAAIYAQWLSLPFLPKISTKEYDAVISYRTPHFVALKKVNAHKKIAWIHTDYSSLPIDTYFEGKMWYGYDHIASISDKCTESFTKCFPQCRDKIFMMENISVPGLIEKQANEFFPEDMKKTANEIVLCSIGRFAPAKNFENIPEMCSILLKSELNVKWYIIGFGSSEALIRQKIIEFNVENNVIILGKKDNPYPYIKYCDVYLQPSRFEGKAVTVTEAQILGKPVVISNYPTAKSQLRNGVDGIIINGDTIAFAEKLGNLLKNKSELERVAINAKNTDYFNADELNNLYSIIQ